MKAERPVVLPLDLWIRLLQDTAVLPCSANVTSKRMTRTLVTPKGLADTQVMVCESYLRDVCAQTVAANAPGIHNLTVYPYSVPCCFWKCAVFSLLLWNGIVLELFEWLLMGSEMDFSPKSSKMPWLRLRLPLWAMKFQRMTCVPLEIPLSFRKWHGIGSLFFFFFLSSPPPYTLPGRWSWV